MQLVKLGRKYINLDHIHCIVEGTDKYVVYMKVARRSQRQMWRNILRTLRIT